MSEISPEARVARLLSGWKQATDGVRALREAMQTGPYSDNAREGCRQIAIWLGNGPEDFIRRMHEDTQIREPPNTTD
jgi:hypothetical protein